MVRLASTISAGSRRIRAPSADPSIRVKLSPSTIMPRTAAACRPHKSVRPSASATRAQASKAAVASGLPAARMPGPTRPATSALTAAAAQGLLLREIPRLGLHRQSGGQRLGPDVAEVRRAFPAASADRVEAAGQHVAAGHGRGRRTTPEEVEQAHGSAPRREHGVRGRGRSVQGSRSAANARHRARAWARRCGRAC